MPSSKLPAVALAVLVVLAGCSMLPGGGGGGDDPGTTDGPGYHELSFYSHTDGAAYNGTLTVRKDGETVYEVDVGDPGDGFFANATFDEPGPYTVVVNTSLPETGGGTMHEELSVAGDLGNATVLTMNYQGVRETRYAMRGDADGALYLQDRLPEPVEIPVRVTHDGETVIDRVAEIDSDDAVEVTDLRGPGVYRVEAKGHNNEWTNETVVVTRSGAKIAVYSRLSAEIVVFGPDEQVPAEPP
jgi:hypothetical protein